MISYDPKKLEGFPFAPKVHQNYFSAAGCQWLLHIGDDEQKRKFSIKIFDAPKNWRLHSSIGKNAEKLETEASYRDLISTRIGGGGESYTFYVKGKPVSVFVKGSFDIPTREIFSAIERIVRLQRDWFEDYEQPFYHVVINERDSVIAGTAVKNQFVCFIRSNAEPDDLNIILAHEMFHDWFPNRLEVKIADDDYKIRHEWFSEGFTTYFAKKILADAGLLSSEKFAGLINEEIQRIADSPLKTATYDDLVSAVKKQNFTGEHKNLAYWRGALIALNWETRLRNSKPKRNLSDFIRALFQFASERKGKISEQEFFDFAKNYGINAKGDFEKHILRGEPIVLEQNISELLGEKFRLVEMDYPSFEPGFDVIESRQSGKITSVIKGGEAYRAGLRDGMEYAGIRNSRRGEGWSAKRPMIVTIKIDGKEKKFEFIPHGKIVKLVQIIKKED